MELHASPSGPRRHCVACYTCSTIMSSEYIHNLAIRLSRALNLINPNDLLAQQICELAQQHGVDEFVVEANERANFPSSKFLPELHRDILSHFNRESAQAALNPSTSQESDPNMEVLMPEPQRAGGLSQNFPVRYLQMMIALVQNLTPLIRSTHFGHQYRWSHSHLVYLCLDWIA